MERAGQIERAEPLAFGSLLREHRVQAGLTQEALAERAGLSARGVSALERGQHQPYRDTAERLAQALGLQGAALKRFLLAGHPRPHGLSTSQEPATTLSPSVTPRVVRAAPPPDRALHNLPSQLTSFVGREREMAEVKRLLETTRLLTLTGTGGCGKTRLAYQVAEQLLEEQPDEFPQGIWQVEMASLSHPDQVAQTVAFTLGLRPTPSQPVVVILESYLKTRRLLLVLDNCEHLLDGVARLVDSLLRSCPGLKVLATSREALRTSGETAWRVPPLSLPQDDGLSPVEDLIRYEAVRLFVERGRAARPDFALSERNWSAVLDICRRLDGMPLALELAAARLRVLSAEELSTRLDDRFRLLTGGSRAALPRQQTLRAAIDWSYDLLDEEERGLLRRLSVFVGGWTLEAAEAVCRREAIPPEDVLDLLAHLVEKSLVVAVEGSGGETRFRLLETIREYAREKLAASDERAEVQGNHAEYYLGLVVDGAPEPLIVATREWVDRLEVERANVRAALHWLLDTGDVERGLRLGCALASFWAYRGPSEEGRTYLALLLEHPAARQYAQGPTALAVLAYLTIGSADASAGRPLVEEALHLAEESGDRSAVALALWISGRFESDPRKAKREILQARSIFEELGDRVRVLQCDLYLVNILTDNVENDEARECCERCIAEARELGVPSLLGQALSVSASMRFSDGDLAGAWRMAEECEKYLAQGGDDPLLLQARYYGACILLRRGEFEAAQRQAELLLQQATRTGDLTWIALGEKLLWSIACSAEDYECAEQHVAREIAAIRRLDPPLGVALCQLDEGSLARAKGELGRARRLLTESLTASRAAGENIYAASALSDLGVVALDEGNLQEARQHFSECLRILRDLGGDLEIKKSLECFGGLAAQEGQPVRALRLLAAGQRLREETGNVAPPAWRRKRASWIEKARQGLGPERAEAAWSEGRAMTLEQAVEYALKDGAEA